MILNLKILFVALSFFMAIFVLLANRFLIINRVFILAGDFDEKLKVDTTIMKINWVVNQIEQSNPNIPKVRPWSEWHRYNESCAYQTYHFDIKFNNAYWQMQKTTNETFYLYGAYYDNRTWPGKFAPVVRILGMVERPGLNITKNVMCQFWFENRTTPVIVKVYHIQYLWRPEWGYTKVDLKPYMLSCFIPPSSYHLVPESVSLVERPCQNATNNLRVIDIRPASGAKQDFAVCVKSLNFQHWAKISVRLVEWIELLKILGAEKITFYQLQVHANISKVLEYYKSSWNVEVVQTTLPGNYPNSPHLMDLFLTERLVVQVFQELIDYNDCLYRNMNLFKFIVLLDIDEVIMPLGLNENWSNLIYKTAIPKAREVEKNEKTEHNVTHSTFVARNVFFLDGMVDNRFSDIPNYMHMMQHVARTKHSPIGDRVKAFHATNTTFALHNHFARACVGEYGQSLNWCRSIQFDLEDAQLQHYCVANTKKECNVKKGHNVTVNDTAIWSTTVSYFTKIFTVYL
ncbi:uncharacterized protein LOC132201414 [Neocloeon triangulifer]|uniref:uncharacterized protein LOC132201414 n=1 Tax=Neocloeon triangulifer TaxID=2078957 RepID=UPI00286F5AF3|nr:uncharacterized protein LOC132201414 [Neocloeon triangulifer]